MAKEIHVHFMGIGGSGIASIAVLAKSYGFKVTGCDMQSSHYQQILDTNKIPVEIGHDLAHLKDVDILAVSPALFDLNPDHPELQEGRRRGILMTWQAFMGRYLQKDKTVLAIAGTHGKSTTTIMAGMVLTSGGLDPVVQAGTVYEPWASGVRIGGSDLFVCEADEFNRNFLNYKPSLLIINNIEMDHPEYFRDFEDFKSAFSDFIKQLKPGGTLIFNAACQGTKEVLDKLSNWLKANKIQQIAFCIDRPIYHAYDQLYKGAIQAHEAHCTRFEVDSPSGCFTYEVGLLGRHNVANALGVIAAAKQLQLSPETINVALKAYRGVSRRTDYKGTFGEVALYDDYGHHPTAIESVIRTFKETYPDRRIVAIVEPHQISRVTLFKSGYIKAFDAADLTIVTKSYLGREKNKALKPVDMYQLASEVPSKNTVYLEAFEDVVKYILSNKQKNDVVIVFGAGDSVSLTQMLMKQL